METDVGVVRIVPGNPRENKPMLRSASISKRYWHISKHQRKHFASYLHLMENRHSMTVSCTPKPAAFAACGIKLPSPPRLQLVGRVIATYEPLYASQHVGEHVRQSTPGGPTPGGRGGWHRQRLRVLIASLLVVSRGWGERGGGDGDIEGNEGGRLAYDMGRTHAQVETREKFVLGLFFPPRCFPVNNPTGYSVGNTTKTMPPPKKRTRFRRFGV